MTRIVAVLSVLLFAVIVSAQNCTSPGQRIPYCEPYVVKPHVAQPYVVAPSVIPVHKEEIIVPIAIPVLVPSTVFQYLPALTNAAYGIPPTPITGIVPGTQGVAVPGAPVQDALPGGADLERLIAARIDAALRDRLRPGDKGPPPLILPGSLPKRLDPPALPETPAQQPAAPQAGDLNQQVANMLASESCIRCHSAGDKPVKGNVTLFTKTGQQTMFQPSVSKKQILDAVTPDASGAAPMPPGGPALSASKLDLLKRWQ